MWLNQSGVFRDGRDVRGDGEYRTADVESGAGWVAGAADNMGSVAAVSDRAHGIALSHSYGWR